MGETIFFFGLASALSLLLAIGCIVADLVKRGKRDRYRRPLAVNPNEQSPFSAYESPTYLRRKQSRLSDTSSFLLVRQAE